MDVKHAAFGLNISSASRIYFVNPVCRPNIEAQAIKRAHRIGQTRKVFVETLLLKGTIEEKMHERAKRMTNLEHHDVSHLEDDYGMREIIQGTKLLPVLDVEKSGSGQMAPLEVPQRLWGRPGWRETLDNGAKGSRPGGKGKQRAAPEEVTQANDGPAEPVKKKKKTVRLATPGSRNLSAVAIPSSSEAPSSSLLGTSALERGFTSAVQDQGDETEDEPMMHRWRRESHVTQQRPAVDGAPKIAVAGQEPAPASENRQMSISDLLN